MSDETSVEPHELVSIATFCILVLFIGCLIGSCDGVGKFKWYYDSVQHTVTFGGLSPENRPQP